MRSRKIGNVLYVGGGIVDEGIVDEGIVKKGENKPPWRQGRWFYSGELGGELEGRGVEGLGV